MRKVGAGLGVLAVLALAAVAGWQWMELQALREVVAEQAEDVRAQRREAAMLRADLRSVQADLDLVEESVGDLVVSISRANADDGTERRFAEVEAWLMEVEGVIAEVRAEASERAAPVVVSDPLAPLREEDLRRTVDRIATCLDDYLFGPTSEPIFIPACRGL